MLESAVVKIGFTASPARVGEMIRAMRSFGTTQVHLVHVRTSRNGTFPPRKRAVLDRLLKDAREAGMEAESHVFQGHPATRIIEAAWQLDAGYVAIPWVKKPVLAQALMGSIDEDVVRMSNAPVFIFKRGFLSPTESLDSVLYATGFKASDRRVMPYLKDRNFQARSLTILHVGDRAPDPATDKARREWVMERLSRLAAECAHAYDTVDTLGEVGPTRRLIVRRARELGVDLVVAGKADDPGMVERFIGSTAEALPHRAPCSVFIIPGPPPDGQGARA